jgi:HlyD family secretion protein
MAGTAVITLVNLAEVYLRAFVPEGQIGRVSVGQPARVYLDSAPAKPVDAYVTAPWSRLSAKRVSRSCYAASAKFPQNVTDTDMCDLQE